MDCRRKTTPTIQGPQCACESLSLWHGFALHLFPWRMDWESNLINDATRFMWHGFNRHPSFQAFSIVHLEEL